MRQSLPFKVSVAGPCSESWDEMSGSLRQRHCVSCNRDVYDFSPVTPVEIERLVARTGGKLCGRITQRLDGSLVTLEPEARQPKLAMLAVAAGLAVTPAVFGQTNVSVAIPASFSLKGSVRDINGGVIVGSKITLVQGETAVADLVTDSAGQFTVLLPAGEYRLHADASGFSHFAGSIVVEAENSAVAEVRLKPAVVETTVEVTTSPATWDTTTGGELTVSYGPRYRRLWFHLRHPILTLRHAF